MEVLPSDSSPSSQIVTSDLIVNRVESTNLQDSPKLMIEILPTEGDNEISYFQNIPEDYETETDPLKIISWPEYYNADRCIREPDIMNNLTNEDWSNIEKVYKKLSDAKFKLNLFEINRERYLLDLIINRYKELHRRLPKIKIPNRKREERLKEIENYIEINAY